VKTSQKLLTICIIVGLVLICSWIAWMPKSGSRNSNERIIRIAVIPAEDQLAMLEKMKPMFQYIEEKTGCKVKPYIVGDYTAVIEALLNKKVDVALLGPFSYVSAHARDPNIVPFAVGVRADTGKTTYHSIIVVSKRAYEMGVKDLESLKKFAKNLTFAFVDPKSTSGYLIPKAALLKIGIDPEKDFKKVVFAGGHDAVEFAIKANQVDAGADADVTYNRLLREGKISDKENIIIWKSPPLPGSPWVYRNDLPEDIKEKIREAFYTMPSEYAQTYGKAIKFVPAKHEDYVAIEEAAKRLGLL